MRRRKQVAAAHHLTHLAEIAHEDVCSKRIHIDPLTLRECLKAARVVLEQHGEEAAVRVCTHAHPGLARRVRRHGLVGG